MSKVSTYWPSRVFGPLIHPNVQLTFSLREVLFVSEMLMRSKGNNRGIEDVCESCLHFLFYYSFISHWNC